LDLLSTKEILALRLLSKSWNECVLKYTGLRRRLQETKISFDFDCVEKIAQFNKQVNCLPFSSFYISGLLEYSPELQAFLQGNGKLVTSLEIYRINARLTDFQFEFLNALPSIKHLAITIIQTEDDRHKKTKPPWRIPKNCMEKLESFGYSWVDKQRYADFWYQHYTNISKLKLVSSRNGKDEEDEGSSEEVADDDYPEDFCCGGLLHFLKKRCREKNTHNLEIEFDKRTELKYFVPSTKIHVFWNCVLKLQGKVKLYNVHALDISKLIAPSSSGKGKRCPEQLSFLLNSIKSVNWISKDLFLLDLPSVEKLRFSNEKYEQIENVPDLKSEDYSLTPFFQHLKKWKCA